ncbi:MAG: hypothetical protein ACKVP5_03265 [Aestuariivirga sp.]
MARTATRRRAKPRSNATSNGTHRLFDDILALAGTLARGRKDSGADKLAALAASTRSFAGSLGDMPNLRVRAASAAESLEGLAEYVSNTEIEQMFEDAGIFARRHPFAAIAISVGAGVAASRYLRPHLGTPAYGRQRQSRSQSSATARSRARA